MHWCVQPMHAAAQRRQPLPSARAWPSASGGALPSAWYAKQCEPMMMMATKLKPQRPRRGYALRSYFLHSGPDLKWTLINRSWDSYWWVGCCMGCAAHHAWGSSSVRTSGVHACMQARCAEVHACMHAYKHAWPPLRGSSLAFGQRRCPCCRLARHGTWQTKLKLQRPRQRTTPSGHCPFWTRDQIAS